MLRGRAADGSCACGGGGAGGGEGVGDGLHDLLWCCLLSEWWERGRRRREQSEARQVERWGAREGGSA